MDKLQQSLRDIRVQIDNMFDQIDLEVLQGELKELQNKSEKPDFWQNPDVAQKIMRRQNAIKERIEPWIKAKNTLDEIAEMIHLGDESLLVELEHQAQDLARVVEKLKKDMRLSGRYDDHDAILTISAGAGGTDAQDWTQILFRMYSRWTEANGGECIVIDESSGDEAGLKRVTCSIDVPLAYGKLRGEHGVHRLVRLSPFNADNLRQTSFAKVDVVPKINEPEELLIDPKDIKIDVFRAGGHGGQSVNTTDSAVRITHIPSGISVSIQNERSQLQNKETAFTILRSKLAQLQLVQHQDKLTELKGPNQSAEWGNQIRSYVLHPYKQVKDLRTRYETSNVSDVLDGKIDPFIDSMLDYAAKNNKVA